MPNHGYNNLTGRGVDEDLLIRRQRPPVGSVGRGRPWRRITRRWPRELQDRLYARAAALVVEAKETRLNTGRGGMTWREAEAQAVLEIIVEYKTNDREIYTDDYD